MAANNLSIRKGKCINFGGGNCKTADTKEIVEVNLGDEFICPECGGMLVEEIKPPKKLLIPAIILLVIGGLIWGVFTFVNLQKNKVKNAVEIGKTVVEKGMEVSDMLSEKVSKLVKEADSFFENKDFDNAKIAINALLALDPDNQHAKQLLSEINKIIDSQSKEGKGEKDEPTNLSSSSVQTINFPNGDKYVGKMKNGKMHDDLGTFYYNNDQIISDKDLKKRKALKGDYLIGEWYEGSVVKGKLYDRNNNPKEVIIIGR